MAACSSNDAIGPAAAGAGMGGVNVSGGAGAGGMAGVTNPASSGGGGTPSASAGSSVGGTSAGTNSAGTSAGSGGSTGGMAAGGSAGMTGGKGLEAWKYFETLKLDTTAQGANVMGNVAKYPVLIALSAANFDFSQASAQGSDLRFSTADGTLLPYAIESWDAAGKQAALWLKLDVKGNATQDVVMSWGNAAATAVADSHSVFDTKDGFLGVWHLGETGSTTAGGYKDATATAADLTGLAVTADSVTAGRAGKALLLSHASKQWLRLDGNKNAAFDVFEHVTYSIWTYATSYAVEYQTPFAKGDNGWRVHMYGINTWGENMNKHIVEMCCETAGGEDECAINEPPSNGSDVAPNKWFHWVAVLSYPTLTLYLNGVKEVSANSGGGWKSDATYPVGIGNNSQITGRSWDGYLDEARVMNVSKDESWVKLEFESQKEGQKFVSYGAPQMR